jgi:hypothetical protein
MIEGRLPPSFVLAQEENEESTARRPSNAWNHIHQLPRPRSIGK